MVSSVLNLSAEDLLEVLTRIGAENAADPEYQELRTAPPAEWPI